MINEQTIEDVRAAINSFDQDKAIKIVDESIAKGEDHLALMNEAFIPAINEIGEKFSMGEMFMPELIQAAEVMKKVTARISEAMAGSEQQEKHGVVVMGTVQGDIHDIGKILVVTLLGVHGFEVHDVGRDIPVETFIEKAVEVNADIIGTSALLTTTMTQQKELEEALKKAGLKGRIKTIIGGAPVTERWAQRIGADAYGENAHEATIKTEELMKK
jgi:trimethylamine corrinoid protein